MATVRRPRPAALRKGVPAESISRKKARPEHQVGAYNGPALKPETPATPRDAQHSPSLPQLDSSTLSHHQHRLEAGESSEHPIPAWIHSTTEEVGLVEAPWTAHLPHQPSSLAEPSSVSSAHCCSPDVNIGFSPALPLFTGFTTTAPSFHDPEFQSASLLYTHAPVGGADHIEPTYPDLDAHAHHPLSPGFHPGGVESSTAIIKSQASEGAFTGYPSEGGQSPNLVSHSRAATAGSASPGPFATFNPPNHSLEYHYEGVDANHWSTGHDFNHQFQPVPDNHYFATVDTEASGLATYQFSGHGPTEPAYFQHTYHNVGYAPPSGQLQTLPSPFRGGGHSPAEMAQKNGESSTAMSRAEVPSDDEKSHRSDHSDREEAEGQSSTPADDSSSRVSGAGSSKSGSSKKRRRFTDDEREQTSKTRSKGVCLRCRVQRIRCLPNPADSDEDTCGSCLRVATESKKTIHHIPCKRWKLIETVWFRRGGLGLTHRWEGTRVKDVKDPADNISHTIQVKVYCRGRGVAYDLCEEPLKYLVRKFNPKEGDSLERSWTKVVNGQIEKRKVPVPPYCLVNVNNTVKTLQKYFDNQTAKALHNVASRSEDLVKLVFDAAMKHYNSLEENTKEKVFLKQLFRLWMAMRLSTGSAYISGDNKLSQDPVNDTAYPLGDKISLPRMVTAQCDGILVEKSLRPLSVFVLKELEKFILQNDKTKFFTIFVATFILLHEVAGSSWDRYRHARDNGMTDCRYSLPSFVQELQFGANIVLLHWHYYKCNLDPFASDLKKTTIAELNEEQVFIVREAWRMMAERPEPQPVDGRIWEDPLFFASQMFRNNWEPVDGFPGFGW